MYNHFTNVFFGLQSKRTRRSSSSCWWTRSPRSWAGSAAAAGAPARQAGGLVSAPLSLSLSLLHSPPGREMQRPVKRGMLAGQLIHFFLFLHSGPTAQPDPGSPLPAPAAAVSPAATSNGNGVNHPSTPLPPIQQQQQQEQEGEEEEEESWATVGKKNRSAVTRVTGMGPAAAAAGTTASAAAGPRSSAAAAGPQSIFGGLLRSVVKAPGARQVPPPPLPLHRSSSSSRHLHPVVAGPRTP